MTPRKQLRALFEHADAQLAGRDWLAGSRSIADPYLFVVTQWAKTRVDLSGLDNLARFDARMAADAGVQAAMKAEGLLYELPSPQDEKGRVRTRQHLDRKDLQRWSIGTKVRSSGPV